jgi:signal-transduction protein with cAMP-binding, CBS, and nucleotidyltransferase domain
VEGWDKDRRSIMKVGYPVRNFMTSDIVSLEATASLSEAMYLMVARDVGSVVVTRNREMVGILTERDVLKRFCADAQSTITKVGDVMSCPLVTIGDEAALGEAASLMAGKKIRRLLVTEDGKIQGIITERDLMRATLDVFRKLIDVWI